MKYKFNQTAINRKDTSRTATFNDSIIEITDSKCFAYGNGKSLSFDYGNQGLGFDIRYDLSYSESDELNYVINFIKDYWDEKECDVEIHSIEVVE